MMRAWVCAVLAGAGVVWSDPAGYTRVKVGDEYAIRVKVEPEVTQMGPDGEPLASAAIQPPYAWEFKYDRTLVQFMRADDGVTATYREVANTPYAVLAVQTELTESKTYWRALKVTDGPVAAPVQNASAAGQALAIVNPDRLDIDAKQATLRVQIEAIVAE